MRATSEQYKGLVAAGGRNFEIKVNIAGVEYGERNIVSCSTSGNTFNDITVGNCASREIDLSIARPAAVPPMAQIKVFCRLIAEGEAGAWMPHGVYFVDTRETDESMGVLSLHGLDAMMKSMEIWHDPTEDAGEWPMSQRAAVENIAARMGVGVDVRTVINSGYKVEYPNDCTMQEVLGFIAAAHGGNWVMSDEGNLLLLPVWAAPPETNFLVDSRDGGAILFGKVRIVV